MSVHLVRSRLVVACKATIRSYNHACSVSRQVSTRNPSGMIWKRGKKTITTVKLEDLPLGLISAQPLPVEDVEPVYPSVLQQARKNMLRFENCVLLTRVGGFYELYFEHAKEYGPLLNLKVVEKKSSAKRINAEPVAMAGFPFFQLDRYLKILVQDLHCYVAIADEIPNDAVAKVKSGGLMHDRKVTRVITPGTLIDENFMDPFTNNYVLSIHVQGFLKRSFLARDEISIDTHHSLLKNSQIGLAWLDLSTGHFFTKTISATDLPSYLTRIGPREIILDEDVSLLKDHDTFGILIDDNYVITYTKPQGVRPISEWTSMLESPISKQTAMEFTTEEVGAGSDLLCYLEARLQSSSMKLQPPIRQIDVMGIDKNTSKALEIKKTIRDNNFSGSLLHTVRRTVTKGGSRLLDSWLSSPSTSIDIINSRLDLVSHMLHHNDLQDRIATILKQCHDSHRLLQKFAFGRGDPDDLLGLASTISATEHLIELLIKDGSRMECVCNMVSRVHLDGPAALAKLISTNIDEEGITQQHLLEEGQAEEMQAFAEAVIVSEGTVGDTSILKKGRKKKITSLKEHYSDDNQPWIMKPSASPTLQRFHESLGCLSKEKDGLTKDLCRRLGVSSLTLRFTPGLGHICHVKGKDIKQDFSNVRSVSLSKSTRSFHHPDWTNLGQRIDQCKIHIRAEELRVLNFLREQVIVNLVKLRRNANVLDELDIACSFALLTAEKGWTRPILNTSSVHKIIGGRHPTVEGSLVGEGRKFVTNDCFVGDVHKAWLITGPNMAGKSTFLRQNALITVLAQIGSYVPAEYAEIGIVDNIFSRVGSADNLYRNQSTFMVEMLETADILKAATSKSFVIMDEIGRGTTPQDGAAVAFAALHHLYYVNKCRTLFATHFHSIIETLEVEGMNGVGYYCTDIEEDGNGGPGFRYIHRLREGVNKESHALKVARLAGMPGEAINVAKRILSSV